ncbi:hypothetical protein CKO28_03125 [Rhodovibrio sodomensis]|uniref:Transcriptional regulator n=1 Tax=Rhodovibrio sodomensis TaxID=1088 RepID=A0ABS1D9E0_9PROT|nr:hypothetical protein [Rhodovibrio sodomensis]
MRDLTKRELTRLVWSKPTMEVARDLGVSDVAVNKACRRLDVLKPPRGFWARVNAGHLPHPEGTPQLTR